MIKKDLEENGKLYGYDLVNGMVDSQIIKACKYHFLEEILCGYSQMPGLHENLSKYEKINMGVLFAALYRNYLKHPELKINEEFENAVIRILNSEHMGNIYSAFDVIFQQLKNEQENTASFRIKSVDVYKAMKNVIDKYKDSLMNVDSYYKSELYENNLYGYYVDVMNQIENYSEKNTIDE